MGTEAILRPILYRFADDGKVVAYVYYEYEPGRGAAAKLLTKDEARREKAQLWWILSGTRIRACAAIHSRALVSEENLPNKRANPFGPVIRTRHIRPFRTVAKVAI